MPKRINWFWVIYFFIFFNVCLQHARDFFAPNSDIMFYYSLLYAFDLSYFFSYFLNLAQILFNLLHAVPLALYACGIYWGTARFWQWLLAGRLIFDLTGRTYEWLGVIAFLKTDPHLAFLISLQFLIFYIPSYVACYRYAFARK